MTEVLPELLEQAVEHQHGGTATLAQSAPIHETFRAKPFGTAEARAGQSWGEPMSIFAKSEPGVEKTYAAILKTVSKFGDVRVEEKKTSIHLCARTGFAGVHPRKSAILLNIRSAAPIKSERIRKIEKVSANRYHNEMLLESPRDVDAEVTGWLKAAHALSVG